MGWRGVIDTRIRRRLGPWVETVAPTELSVAVEACWLYSGPAGVRPPAHRVLPSIGTSLCLHWWDDGELRDDARLLVMGPVVTPRTFTPKRGEGMAAVSVRPEWTRAIFGVPGARLDDAVVDAAQVLGRRAIQLRDRALAAFRREGSPLGPLLAWIEDRLDGGHDGAARLVGAALDRALGRSGRPPVSLDRAAGEAGVSSRHLRRLVRQVTGTGAKRLHRVHRLDRVVADADRTGHPRWSSLAVAHGFYDQAHLIQECRALVGVTPVEMHRRRRLEHVRFFQDEGGGRP